MPIPQTQRYFENPYYNFFKRTYALSVKTSKKKRLPVLKQIPTQILP